MKPRSLILIVFVAVVLGVMFYSMTTGSSGNYEEEIIEERKEKDQFFKTSKESPLPADKREHFEGLSYFPPDADYRILADLVPVDSRQVRVLPTSDGKEERYMEYAFAEFDLHGKRNRLLILEMIGMGPTRGKLFLAFGDETSARETYGGGRYLDITKVPGASTITLDFNKAYSPYCAYNSTYSCPLPPRENLLKVPIRAGEQYVEDF